MKNFVTTALSIAVISAVLVAFFVLGNIIYTTNFAQIIKILVSELSFITIYTIIDKSNYKYGFTFTSVVILLLTLLYLPSINVPFLSNINIASIFYSRNVQLISVTILICGAMLNAVLIKQLLQKNFSILFSSRLSTSIATLVEVSVFSYLLDLGIQGFFITLSVRILFIVIVPKIVFYSKSKPLFG